MKASGAAVYGSLGWLGSGARKEPAIRKRTKTATFAAFTSIPPQPLSET
jgi:hypothetical protein